MCRAPREEWRGRVLGMEAAVAKGWQLAMRPGEGRVAICRLRSVLRVVFYEGLARLLACRARSSSEHAGRRYGL